MPGGLRPPSGSPRPGLRARSCLLCRLPQAWAPATCLQRLQAQLRRETTIGLGCAQNGGRVAGPESSVDYFPPGPTFSFPTTVLPWNTVTVFPDWLSWPSPTPPGLPSVGGKPSLHSAQRLPTSSADLTSSFPSASPHPFPFPQGQGAALSSAPAPPARPWAWLGVAPGARLLLFPNALHLYTQMIINVSFLRS